MEQKLLAAAAQDRGAWHAINQILSPEEWSPEGTAIYRYISEFYETDKNAKRCDIEIIADRAARETASNKVADLLVSGIRGLVQEVSAVNIIREARELKAHTLGLKIASQLSTGKIKDTTRGLMTEYLDLVSRGNTADTDEEIFNNVSALELVRKDFDPSKQIQLYPKVLNDNIDGGLRGGHHILIFALTEMGKSLIARNACYGFLKQGLITGYVGNEDPASDMQMCMMTRLTGMNKYEILADPKRADELLSKRNWNKFIFANLAPGTFPRIHSFIEKYGIQVLVIDQLRNIDVASDSRTQALEKAATEARNTAKRYNIPVISITQAADSASGKTILNRGDVDSSNVGIPGQVDLMLGVGATQDMEERNLRMLSFPKNKLSGKHAPIQIVIDPLLSKVIE